MKNSGRAADLIADLYEVFSRDTVDCTIDDEINDKRPASRAGFAKATFRLGEINAM
jgi:hypothetical protein